MRWLWSAAVAAASKFGALQKNVPASRLAGMFFLVLFVEEFLERREFVGVANEQLSVLPENA